MCTRVISTSKNIDMRYDDTIHGDVIKWKHFPRNWPCVRGIHRSPVNSPHKGQWRGALLFSLICVWINGWVYNREASDLKHHRALNCFFRHVVQGTAKKLSKIYINTHIHTQCGSMLSRRHHAINTSNGSWCMGIKGEMSGTVCVTFTWYMYIYELFIAFVCFVVCSLL